MGFSKNSRANRRSSSSYCSTITMTMFVCFCLLGVWMLTSSAVAPGQRGGFAQSTIRKETRTQVSSSRAYEDNPGDLPDDAIRGDEQKSGTNKPDDQNEDEPSMESPSKNGGERSEGGGNAGYNNEEPDKNSDQILVERNDGGNHESHLEEREEAKELEGRESEPEHNSEQPIEDETKKQSTEEKEKSNEDQDSQQEPEKGEKQQSQREESAEYQQSQTDERNENQSAQSEGQGENQLESQSEDKEDSREDGQSDEKEENQQAIQSEKENEKEDTQQEDQSEQEDAENQQSATEESTEKEEFSGEEAKGWTQSQTTENQQQSQEEERANDSSMNDSFPNGSQSEILNVPKAENGSWATQASQSQNEKKRQNESHANNQGSAEKEGSIYDYTWELCNVTAGPDYIPCLDNELALKKLHSTGHYEHRERHCPEESPTCLVPLPWGYKKSLEWPGSRDKIWYHNVPHTKLAIVKGHQNWVKVTGEYLTFPGGGTQFIHGALHYIDFIQQSVPIIGWGKHTRVILDVGCGVASFGGYLFDRDVVTMSFAPKDEHEAQVQFALERGIPAISAVMGSQRLPFPSRVFDLIHCARCRVPWHADGGMLLLELNRVLRPGGFFVWSATPVYQKLKEDVEIWKEMTKLTISMCWELYKIKKDRLNSVGAAIYRKPFSNDCYNNRKHNNPPLCDKKDDPNAAWYVPLQSCMHKVPVDNDERGSRWPEEWPQRLRAIPYWLNRSQIGVYGKPVPDDFVADYKHWKRVVSKSYISGLGISWSSVRNVMDMRAVYGGFAAALSEMKVWVMNVVNVDSPDTLPIIYERGLFGIYHDWCESFSTYPRTYDLLHADHLFSRLDKRCNLVGVMTEVDRILRPGGTIIVRDESATVSEVENLAKSLHWEVSLTFSKDKEGMLCAKKTMWRPENASGSS
ncbi:probable methyltransferase PMT24 isoform X1 [Amborella trichopoda]|uniref:Methyltransferase n=2 Tax=Amborella trichopoda TaxID=13333 RepID=W1NKG2_AMBTC|nr:probable methyltransferase PMT24 isoform X1 [Amborella trichopoda]ERM96302.1 hypothetical protein AMTR_s00001p00185010 [Amborella trichopoda]|eukprot:XP_006828886.3 probable methyltransferase PMT24 isoform X1 [Amborella trichopoda]